MREDKKKRVVPTQSTTSKNKNNLHVDLQNQLSSIATTLSLSKKKVGQLEKQNFAFQTENNLKKQESDATNNTYKQNGNHGRPNKKIAERMTDQNSNGSEKQKQYQH